MVGDQLSFTRAKKDLFSTISISEPNSLLWNFFCEGATVIADVDDDSGEWQELQLHRKDVESVAPIIAKWGRSTVGVNESFPIFSSFLFSQTISLWKFIFYSTCV